MMAYEDEKMEDFQVTRQGFFSLSILDWGQDESKRDRIQQSRQTSVIPTAAIAGKTIKIRSLWRFL